MDIPIIVYHLGYRDYVPLCMKQALKNNDNVILITDNLEKYKEIKGLTLVDSNKYVEKINTFQKLYIHLSTNSRILELLCIIRWFVVHEYMNENNIERAFICDSDILIYDNITEVDDKYLKQYPFMLCSSPSKNLCGSHSIWNISELEKFVKFAFNYYENQENRTNMIEWYSKNKSVGGICDMTLLYYFAHNESKFNGLRLPNYPSFKMELNQIFDNNFTFDLHMDSEGNHKYPEDWEMTERGSKNIKYINNVPYCYNKRLKKDIRFALLHFQGRNKSIMGEYYNKINK
tara:strand:+ start:2231 stop:3097 length:867 start_codon:yes stop_codon:yes gene_type:complete